MYMWPLHSFCLEKMRKRLSKYLHIFNIPELSADRIRNMAPQTLLEVLDMRSTRKLIQQGNCGPAEPD